MKSDFKKVFLSSLLTVLFVVSNLIGLKYTSFNGMIVSVNFVTYPFIMLCILLLVDMFGKKGTYSSILSTVFIQVFILLSYSLTVKMNNQMIIPDISTSINTVFTVDEVSLLASLIGFMVSNYIIIFLFNIFKKNGKKVLGVVLGTFSALTIYGLIFILICYYGFEREILGNLLLSHVFISVIMTIVVTVLFFVLKNRDCIYTEDDSNEVVFCFDEEEQTEFTDKTILEVISINEKARSKKETNNKETNRKNNSREQSLIKKDKKTTNNKSKTVNKSKTTVKK